MLKITDLPVPLDYDENLLRQIAAKRLDVDIAVVKNIIILKRSVSGGKDSLHFKMDIAVSISGDEDSLNALKRDKNVSKALKYVYTVPVCKTRKRPVIVGCGPAGLFAGLVLAEAGAAPVLFERGMDVDNRRKSVMKFWRESVLDTNSNVQFGEGGAGAFSDGKLKIGSRNYRVMKVLSEFVEAGAPPDIMYLAKPHIGTDRLYTTVKGLRNKIIRLGGEVHFNTTVTDILRKNGRVCGVGFIHDGEYSEIAAEDVILAIGHSARDTFERLLDSGIVMEQKPFAVGVRIEHPQELIDKIIYGRFAGNPALGAADYKSVVHLENGRNVYTFCMCPGGSVIAATSEENRVVTNGMSEYARDGKNANSALLVTVSKNDFESSHPLAGITFQRKIESAAFAASGSYKAPAQRLEDFLKRRCSKSFGSVLPTYMPGTEFCEVDSYMPDFVADSLRQAVPEMDEWLPGFAYPDAVLTGAETRTTSPVRIKRQTSLEADGIEGLYPCGEGAGYAGGILSAAVDGMLCAERILNKYASHKD
jgi:uncharacterized FAD-dependent dehydrogenase